MAASDSYRHRSSLEGFIDFTAEEPLEANQHARAKAQFYRIIERFEPTNVNRDGTKYNRPALVRLTYEYARSELSQNIFLRAFFGAVALPIECEDDVDFDKEGTEECLRSAVCTFADHLFDNFFLPFRASAGKTPRFSPLTHSAILQAQGGSDVEEFVGTPQRAEALRGACLARDRHRCVITRKFDTEEAMKRSEISGVGATDDDGTLLRTLTGFSLLEVAHILPHSLTKTGSNDLKLSDSKRVALDILNMFDHGIIHLIEGNDIDQPRNAILITNELHHYFDNFKIFFEAVPNEDHTYLIKSFLDPFFVPGFPTRRTLYLAKYRNIDPPSPRLLAIHSAISHILHLSGAGELIAKILKDMEWKDTRADGSTELGRLVTLRLDGWVC